MSEHIQPSDVYKAFTWPHLIALAKILFETREWVAEDARQDRGDSLCGIGFRAWEQTKFFVAKAAAKEFSEWLSITDAGPVFKFKLDMMPIRFCRGDSEEPLPINYAIADIKERADMALAFDANGQGMFEGVFRFLIEADSLGAPQSVYLVQADADGATLRMWAIPKTEDGTGVAPIVVPQTPVQLPPLEVESVNEAAERERKERETAEEERERKERELRRTDTEKGA